MPAPAKKEEKTIKKTDTVKKETVYIKKTESRAKNIELDLIPGSLIREKGKTNVYFITPQRFKKHILNEEILNSYEGNQDKEIQVVDKKTIKKYPDVKLIKVKDQSEIYFLEKGKKRLIQNNDIFDARGFKQADIVIINEFELDAYQNGNDLSLKKSNSFKRIIEFFTSLLGN